LACGEIVAAPFLIFPRRLPIAVSALSVLRFLALEEIDIDVGATVGLGLKDQWTDMVHGWPTGLCWMAQRLDSLRFDDVKGIDEDGFA
jgi:hypothetical protein